MEGEERSDSTDRTTEHEDELRVQRIEEELRAGTREREAAEVVEEDVRREEIYIDDETTGRTPQ